MRASPNLNIVVALPCEAKPLKRHYKLTRQMDAEPFTVYVNKAKSIHLIVSGVGKVKSAAATAWIAQYSGNKKHHTYLNLGIAGGNIGETGDVFVANKVIDAALDQAWYPSAFMLGKQKQAMLMTHNQPQHSYPESSIVDMESSGFFPVATLFVAQEQVQVVKVISDNCEASMQAITATVVEAFIDASITTIGNMVAKLLKLSEQEEKNYSTNDCFVEITKQWHFTVYQQTQLKEILRRWFVLFPDVSARSKLDGLKDASIILRKLESHLQHADYTWVE